MIVKLFSSTTTFQTIFANGLTRILEQSAPTPEQLLVATTHAIISRDQQLLDRARRLIEPRLRTLKPTDTNEDYQVLHRIFQTPDPFALIHRRTTPAGFQLQYNELRSYRPRREAQAAFTNIHQPYDAAKFNFTHIPEVAYWQGEFDGTQVACFYNKYPFEPQHSSIVPDPNGKHEQFLTPKYHHMAWKLLQKHSKSEPNALLAYNSLGSYASINHLHFQMISDGSKLPLINTTDLSSYPIAIIEHHDPQTAWLDIARLQTTDQPFNLIYAPGRLLLIERRPQGTYPQPSWTTGFAWYELCGGIITVDEASFSHISDKDIENALENTIYAPKVLSV